MTCKEAWKSLIEGIKNKYIECHNRCNLHVSDTVKVVHKYDTWECGCMLAWNPEMDDTVGKIGKINTKTTRGYIVSFNDGKEYTYPFFVLEKIEEPKPELKPGQLILVKKLRFINDKMCHIYCLDMFSHEDKHNNRYETVSGCYNECMPYEGNEHLLGKETK